MNKITVVASAAVTVAVGLALAPSASGANPDTLAQFTAAIDEMVAKYGLAPIPVVPDVKMRHPDIAASAIKGDHINLSDIGGAMTPAEFNAWIQPAIDTGFIVDGCPGIRGIAIHETAHIIEVRKNYEPRNELNAAGSRGEIMDDGLARHSFEADGTLAEGEALAYAFQAVECGSATPNERKMYDILVN